jgi:hypothetical protein
MDSLGLRSVSRADFTATNATLVELNPATKQANLNIHIAGRKCERQYMFEPHYIFGRRNK